MGDLKDSRVIKLKGILFLVMGVLSGGLLLVQDFSWQKLLLLCIAVWSFSRFYYFAFYVIEKYVDSKYRFAGLWDFAKYLRGRGKKGTEGTKGT